MLRNQRQTEEWQALDRAHYLHPFTNHKAMHDKGSRIVTHADNIYLWDSDGKKILDAMAGLWCVNVGYGRQELADIAREQMLQLPYYNSFFQTAHPPAIELAQRLSEIAPVHLNHAFFTSSGSESNDTVLRLVRHYWALLDQPQRSIVISRHNAYHGSTMAGASLGGMLPMHKQGGLPIPGIEHIAQPYWYLEGGTHSPEEFGIQTARELEKKIKQLGEHRVAAFIGEPVQGAGGVIVPPDSYWPEIQRICQRYGILLIADEVICGFGRTGNWFGSETFGIEADLMPIAKGLSSGYLPIGGVLVADRIADVLINQGGEFFHGYTYSGHPTACAVAIANLDILQRENLINKVAQQTGPYLAKRWGELAEHPLVGEARTCGLLGALELVADKTERKPFEPRGDVGALCRDKCFENGLVMRAVYDTMVISPPLVISPSQIDELVELAHKSLDQTAAELAKH